MPRLPAIVLLPALAAVSVAVIALALLVGSADLAPREVLGALAGSAAGDGERLAARIVLDLRLPRALTAFAVGGLLALAGVLMQVLLRNPLADPYILGISGGAAVAALSLMMLGFGAFWIDLGAFAGALGATLLVFGIARGTGSWTPTRLLLTGVVLAAGFSAVLSLLLALGPERDLRGMIFWLMGDLSFAASPWTALALLGAATLLGLPAARQLNLLAHGELQASLLGQHVGRVRGAVYAVSALLTAVAVTHAGTIGFVGLIVPHLVRLLTGSDHRRVLPASALAGGSLLVLADTLARTVLAPRQLPVGALMAVIGVPLFLVLVSRRR